MKNTYWLFAILFLLALKLVAQGPPITGDKPIMLGGGSFTVRTLVEIRKNNRGTFTYVPLTLNYLPTSNYLVAVTLPYINYDLENGQSSNSIADIKVLGKYQFLRKDGTGKTFRMALKSIQTLPTGEKLDVIDLSTGKYSGYYGVIAGYESLKYGISNELGYKSMPDGTLDEFRYKLGFGLPLLKPQYPNKQINLYFEYTNSWLTERDSYVLLYAQGIQYARKNFTFDLAVQTPLVNDRPDEEKVKYSIFFGTRYTF